MKLCPKCGLNYIGDNIESCIMCVNKPQLNGKIQKHRSKPKVEFGENFVFSNESAYHRGKNGYRAYNENGDNVGIVYMNDDRRRVSCGCCELCFYTKFHSRYGEWHIVKSHGSYVKWDFLCKQLDGNSKYICYID